MTVIRLISEMTEKTYFVVVTVETEVSVLTIVAASLAMMIKVRKILHFLSIASEPIQSINHNVHEDEVFL